MAQLEAEIAQPNEAPRQRQQIAVATGRLAKRFAISPERAWPLAFDENTGVAGSKGTIVKDQP